LEAKHWQYSLRQRDFLQVHVVVAPLVFVVDVVFEVLAELAGACAFGAELDGGALGEGM
jgi:hypothetical protein